MKKTLIAISALLSPMAATASITNMENPLFMPGRGEGFSRSSIGLMYKENDSSEALRDRNMDGRTEWPIWRFHQDLGFGITDRLTVRGHAGFTYNEDISRRGFHEGRIGLAYRVLDGTGPGSVFWDVYGYAHMGGIFNMRATLIPSANPAAHAEMRPISFDFHNYSNGRYGTWLGTQVGRVWNNFTLATYVEVLRTFGSSSATIELSDPVKMVLSGGNPALLPDELTARTASAWETKMGLRSFYQIDDDWGISSGFTWRHRPANSVSRIDASGINPALLANPVFAATLESFTGSMHDRMDEYIFSAAIARRITDNIQAAFYMEYTFDSAGERSQNGTDVKAEMGFRLNVQF